MESQVTGIDWEKINRIRAQVAGSTNGVNELEGSEVPLSVSGSAGSTGSAGFSGEHSSQEKLEPVLDDLSAWFRRFVYLPNELDYETLTLWTVHTWFITESRTTPRLLIESPVPESGKTTLLEHLEKLCLNPVRMANAGTPSALTRLLQTKHYTLLLDEADRTLDPRNEGFGELTATLNTGYKMGGYRLVNVPTKEGWRVEQMPTFAAVALAGNNPKLQDDTRTRCITIRLLRDTQGRVQDSDWEFIEEAAIGLRDRIETAVEPLREVMRVVRPALPSNCRNRDKERWQPLKKVAALAGPRWEAVADAAIVRNLENVEQARVEEAANVKPSVQLVLDLATIFGKQEDFIDTETLVEQLQALNPNLWLYGDKPLKAQGLGSMLSRNFGIHSARRGKRGYNATALVPTWEALGVLPESRMNRTNRQESSERAGDIITGCDQALAPQSVPEIHCRKCGESLLIEEDKKSGLHFNCDSEPF